VLAAAHGRLGTLLESGEVTKIAHSLSTGARTALEHSYRVGFTEAFTTIAFIAAILALVGAVLAFVLVRSRDFVSAGELPATPGADEPVAVAAG
jgi:prolipoprotein diacylglyceryltransferase